MRTGCRGALICFGITMVWLLVPYYGAARVSALSPGPERAVAFQVPFIPNHGQVDRNVAFYTIIPAGTAFITLKGDIVYALGGSRDRFVIRENFIRARMHEVQGETLANTRVNYYLGSDPSKWRQGLDTFRSVDLGEKYEFIDVRVAADKNGIEKIFTIRPGGDASHITGRIENAGSLAVGDAGELVVISGHGKAVFSRPEAYQIKNGEHVEVEASYVVRGTEYGFAVGEYDRTLPLVIDPLLASTYVGGKSNETTYAVGISGGDVIVAGSADSVDFPGLDGKIDVLGDSFILRLDPELSTVRAASFFGGSLTDGVRDITVDGSTIYAAGFNNSPDFPTTPGAAYSGTSLSGSFVARFDTVTLRMTAATSFYANVFGLAWSPGGKDVYIAGATGNRDLPIPVSNTQAFQATHRGGADSFVVAFDEDLTYLKAATYLGGEGFDIIYDMTVDGRGYPVVAGVTNSAAFPVKGAAFDSTYNLTWNATHQWIDGFVARLTPGLDDLDAATYIGGGWNDNITAVAADRSLILVGGSTSSADFPCASTFGPIDGNDAFVVLLDGDLSKVRSCSVFGGSRPGAGSPESVSDVAFHPSGSIYASGRTNATDFPTTQGAFLSRPSGSYFGAFIIAFNREMSKVEASTLIHGGSEDLKALVFNDWGDVIVAGDSSGGGYPVTPGALQSEHAGGDDLVVSRFTSDLTGAHIEMIPETLDFGHLPIGMESGEEIIVHNTGGAELILTDLELVPDSTVVFNVKDQCLVVPAFDSCPIEVIFRPTSPGFMTARLIVHSNDPFRKTAAVELEGTAIAVPSINLSANTLLFGKVAPGSSSSAKGVVVKNEGASDLVIQEVRVVGLDADDFLSVLDNCSIGAVKPGEKCLITLRLLPGDEGQSRARMEILSNDPMKPMVPVDLVGWGADSPMISAEPDPCEFGDVIKGSSLSKTVRVTNRGGGDLYMKEVSLAQGQSGRFSIQGDGCSGNTLKPWEKGKDETLFCEVQILFAPAAVERASGNLLLISNDPDSPVRPVILTGTGVAPNDMRYPGLLGWMAILILVLRMVLGLPVSASGWKRWMRKNRGKSKG